MKASALHKIPIVSLFIGKTETVVRSREDELWDESFECLFC
jgi:hypothetical protein